MRFLDISDAHTSPQELDICKRDKIDIQDDISTNDQNQEIDNKTNPPKKNIQGGYLRNILNYSDRF